METYPERPTAELTLPAGRINVSVPRLEIQIKRRRKGQITNGAAQELELHGGGKAQREPGK